MAESKDGAVGRRRFITDAAVTAAAMVGQGQVAGAQQPSSDETEHEHQAVPSDIALRVKALESVLVEKEMVDPADLDAVVDIYKNRTGSVPGTAPESSRARGPIPTTRRACWPMAPRRSSNWDTAAGRASTW